MREPSVGIEQGGEELLAGIACRVGARRGRHRLPPLGIPVECECRFGQRLRGGIGEKPRLAIGHGKSEPAAAIADDRQAHRLRLNRHQPMRLMGIGVEEEVRLGVVGQIS